MIFGILIMNFVPVILKNNYSHASTSAGLELAVFKA